MMSLLLGTVASSAFRAAQVLGTVDPSWWNVSFVSGFEGTEGASVFADEGPAQQTLTNINTPKTMSVAAVMGTTGLHAEHDLNGGEDSVQIDVPGLFDFGTGDFTIEGFAQCTQNHATYPQSIVGNFNQYVTGSWCIYKTNDPNNLIQFSVDGQANLVGTTNVGLNRFHFAISRNGAVIRLFVNGVMEATRIDYGTVPVGGMPRKTRIGGNENSVNERWRGYIDEVRITSGVGRYDSDLGFTVPTEAYPRSAPPEIHVPGQSLLAVQSLTGGASIKVGNQKPYVLYGRSDTRASASAQNFYVILE